MMRERGFTLIEMLVALMIFALLSLAGVALLRGSVSAQGATRDHLDRLGDLQVAIATLDADLNQATVRITRTEAGTLAPAFFAGGTGTGGPVLQFVRAGWSNASNAPRASLQKVDYYWREGRFERVGYPMLDGAAPEAPVKLLDRVSALTLRFRDDRGQWREAWTPTQPDLIPRLVEMTLQREGGAPVTLRFLVGPGGVERPPEPSGG